MPGSGLAAAVLAVAFLPAVTSAQTVSPSVEHAARCAPAAGPGLIPADAPRIVASQDSQTRSLFGPRDLLIVDAGTNKGLRVGQQFVIRQISAFGERRQSSALRAVTTAGWLRIAAANETTSIAVVDLVCGGIFAGDFLEPLVTAPLPAGTDRDNPSGEADFSTSGRVLFGDHERESAGSGDFVVVSTGAQAAAGARFAVYRDMRQPGVPLAWVGEAVAIHVEANTAVVRITNARDAIFRGDLIVPRR